MFRELLSTSLVATTDSALQAWNFVNPQGHAKFNLFVINITHLRRM